MKYLLLILLTTVSLVCEAQFVGHGGMNRPSLGPSLTLSGLFTAFSSAVGTPSGGQQAQLSGFNLTVDAAITITGSSGVMELSFDNVNWFASLTSSPSAGSISPAVTINLRIKASAPAGTYSGNLHVTSGAATPVDIAYNATVNSTVTEAKFIFGADASMQSVAGWTQCFNPTGNTVTNYTDVSTGWILHRVGSSWKGIFGTQYGSNVDGATTGTWGSEFPQGTTAGWWINIGSDATFANVGYGMYVDGMPAGTYIVEVLGSVKSSYNAGITTPEVRVRFGEAGGTENEQHSMNNQNNTQTYLTFPVTPNTGTISTGGKIYISVNPPTSLDPGGGVVSTVRVKKIS